MSTILDIILARKRDEVEERQRQWPLAELRARIADTEAVRPFAGTIETCIGAGKPAVIAEIKRASPSRGLIREDFDPAAIAASYARSGAACLSVLTDHDFFQGDESYLYAAHRACALPVLRKDFMVDPYQIYESRTLGADCVLLIVAALTDERLRKLYELADELGMNALIEVHTPAELERALALPGGLLGINNRNLKTFETHLGNTLDMCSAVPSEWRVITESGIHTTADVLCMRAAGIQAFLVGEALMRAPDPGVALNKLFFEQEAK